MVDLFFWCIGLLSAVFHVMNLASGRFAFFFVGLLLLLVFAAAAQVGRWRDSDGGLVAIATTSRRSASHDVSA